MGGEAFACGSSGALTSYMGTLEVQKALHAVPKNSTVATKWQMWDGDGSNYNITVADARAQYKQVLEAGVRTLIYNGLRDTALPFNGAENWTREIGQRVSEPRRLWQSDGNVAGHVVTYSNGLTFATINGAGHLVPADRPIPARTMVASFLNNKPLPVYTGDKCTRIWLGRGWGNFCEGQDDPTNTPKQTTDVDL